MRLSWLIALGAFLFLSAKRAFGKLPVAGIISSPFGWRIHPITGKDQFHNGIDIASIEGTDVHSPWPGVVKSVYYTDAGGKQIVITHDNGYTTGYAHLKNQDVGVNDRVEPGRKIGEVGRTGAVTGAHLHFTMKDVQGNYVDPLKHLS